jgi:hypothetical protein
MIRSSNSTPEIFLTVSSPYISNCVALRYNSSLQRLEGNTGHSWEDLTANIDIKLSNDVKSVMDWAKDKMNKEQQYKILATEYTSVKDALDNLTKAQERLDIVSALVKNGENNDSQ